MGRSSRITAPAAAFLLVAVLVVPPSLGAQRGAAGDAAGAGQGLPLNPAVPLKFTTDEGTWISLDIR